MQLRLPGTTPIDPAAPNGTHALLPGGDSSLDYYRCIAAPLLRFWQRLRGFCRGEGAPQRLFLAF